MVFIFTNSNKRSTNVVKFDNSRGLALLLALAIAPFSAGRRRLLKHLLRPLHSTATFSRFCRETVFIVMVPTRRKRKAGLRFDTEEGVLRRWKVAAVRLFEAMFLKAS